jgi:hypothetical protein
MKNLLIVVFTFYFTAQIVIHCSAQGDIRKIVVEAKTPKTWVLLIGIDNYPKGIPALRCCTADTESLRNAFLKSGIDADYITVMNDNYKDTNPLYPNSTNIETQITLICQGAGKDEDVVISFSGHGLEDKNTGEAFWATKNIVLKDNTVDKKTVISRRWVEKTMRESKAAKKLLISDCCRQEFNIAEGIKALAGSHFKVADSFDEEYSRSLSKSVFGGKFTGFAKLTSCSEGQLSREHRTKKNGVFTYFLVEGLSGRAAKDGKITLMDLYDYASVATRAYVRTEFSSLQMPVMWAEGDENKMGMEKYAREFILANLPNNPPFKPVGTTTEIKPTTPDIPNKPSVVDVQNRNAGDLLELTIKGVKWRFRWCPPGTFMMGDSPDRRNTKIKPHQVTLTQGFFISETETTQEQWMSITGAYAYRPREKRGEQQKDISKFAAYGLSWINCEALIQKLNQLSVKDLPQGYRFDFPSEAQWEYACRAGTTGNYAGNGNLHEMGWYRENSNNLVQKVATKKPNDWGIYDMHGNVAEWCNDWAAEYEGDVTDPKGAVYGEQKILRGGDLRKNEECRSASRNAYRPSYGGLVNPLASAFGLRLALVSDSK